jgi:hypothetical protein
MQAYKEGTSSTQSHSVRRSTASSLLARILPNQNIEHKMRSANHSLRRKAPVTYAESNGSAPSPVHTPAKPTRKSIIIIDEEQSEDELDQIVYAERKSSAGHSLRPRKSLILSAKAAENGDKTKSKSASVSVSTLSSIRAFRSWFSLTISSIRNMVLEP